MLHPLRAAARFIDQKIGWNRIGLALSLVIIGTAAVVLYRMLRGIDVRAMSWRRCEATERRDIMLAALFVAAGYFTLTFYDLFALRTIGANHVPYRVAALAGFTSYSVGHNVGASVFTGGAVRYRVYSAWGLTAIDVAKICFIAGLTFWLGNVTVLGLGIAYEPQAASAIDQLPPWFNRMHRDRGARRAGRLCRLGVGQAARDRPRRLGRDAAGRAADAAADRDRHHRSRLLRARHVRADAGRPAHRLHQARGDLRVGDPARLREPLARRARRVRRRHAGRADRIRARKNCSPGCCCSGCSTMLSPSRCRSSILGVRELWLGVAPKS